jgi:hypothetical protein
LLIFDELQCLDAECGVVGMLVADAFSLEQRFGADLVRAGWTPLPDALLSAELDFGPHELLVIWVLESYRWRPGPVWPSHDTIATRTGLSVSTVKRTLRGLINTGLIKPSYREGRSTRYDVAPLWTYVANDQPRPQGPGSDRPRPGGRGVKRRHPGHTDPPTQIRLTHPPGSHRPPKQIKKNQTNLETASTPTSLTRHRRADRSPPPISTRTSRSDAPRPDPPHRAATPPPR